MELEVFLSKLDGVRHQPSGISARCPAHPDSTPSLSVNEGKEGGIVLLCHAGCATEDVVAAMGLTMADLSPVPHVVDTYPYVEEDGRLRYTMERWTGKNFKVIPTGLPPAQRLLYRADALAQARAKGKTVYVCEGEKDANTVAALGLVSTTNPFGAMAWLPHYAEQLRGLHVIVIADNDESGYNHAREVWASVEPVAASIALVKPRFGKDVTDLIEAGWSLNELDPLPQANELGTVRMSNVLIRQVTWAWPGYIPFGKVTIIEGDPGDGKSVLTVDLAARWTTKMDLPDDSVHAGPYHVVLITAEDDPEDTVAPRLMAAGANLDLIESVDHGTRPGQPFIIDRDTEALYRVVIENNAKIVVLDPLSAFLGDKVDSHNDASVRTGLYPLYRLARDTGAAIIVVRHLNKGSGAKALYRGGGSIGFIGAARAAYTVGRDPEDENRRIMACTKLNIAPMPPSLAYSIRSGTKGPYLEWHGIVEANAQDVLDGEIRPSDVEIVNFLNSVVENGKPMTWRAIVDRGREEGFTEKQLRWRRGRSRLVKIVGEKGGRSTTWGYPEHQLATAAHLPATDPLAPHLPRLTLPQEGGQVASGSPDATSPTPLARSSGVSGRQEGPGGKWDVDDRYAEEDRRDEELDALPLACQVCGSVDATRWAKPHWTVRCDSHNPLTYGGRP